MLSPSLSRTHIHGAAERSENLHRNHFLCCVGGGGARGIVLRLSTMPNHCENMFWSERNFREARFRHFLAYWRDCLLTLKLQSHCRIHNRLGDYLIALIDCALERRSFRVNTTTLTSKEEVGCKSNDCAIYESVKNCELNSKIWVKTKRKYIRQRSRSHGLFHPIHGAHQVSWDLFVEEIWNRRFHRRNSEV